MDTYKVNLIEQTLQRAINNREIAGANILILDKGEETYYTHMGLADVEANKPIERNSIFRLYSMTKPVTAVAVMLLMERGIIDLMDPVCKYIPGFMYQKVDFGNRLVPAKHDLNIKELLNMTSGLLYDGENITGMETVKLFEKLGTRLFSENPMTTMEFANELGLVPLHFQPGDSWNYGTSADVLGAVLEVASGKQFGDFLMEELFRLLNMVDTDFYVPNEKEHRLVSVYETTKTGLQLYEGNHLGIINKMNRKPSFQSGGAGLVSTVDDYAKFAKMLLNDGTYEGRKILTKRTVEFLTTQVLDNKQSENFREWNNLVGYSYGNLMRVCTSPELGAGIMSKGEYGWDGWLGCYFANLPKEHKTILIMMQKKDAGTIAFTRKIRNIILS